MLNQTNAKRVLAGGTAQPTTFGLRLCFWHLPTTAANMGWGLEPPPCETVELEVLGVWSARKVKMDVQAVFPRVRLPKMNSSAKATFIKALKEAVQKKVGVPATGISRDVVDWDGNETEWGYS